MKFIMNRAKVLFSYLERKRKLVSPTFVGKYLEAVAFIQTNVKVNLYFTNINMEDMCDIAEGLKGMKKLDKNAFNKTITVPCLTVTRPVHQNVWKVLKKQTLKIKKIKSVEDLGNGQIRILFDPKKVNSLNDIDENIQEKLENISEENFSKTSVDITYDNWNAESVLKAVLPKDEPALRSFSVIGHIIQLNIKEHLLDYRYVIAEILLDKIPFAKTVVYKKSYISNVYRNSELEVLCGEPDFITTAKENGCQFKLDLSKVYWNPRLSTEHERITFILKKNDVLFDVFAGIGPFAIPAAMKKCLVFANDLNPDSVKWLNYNIQLNKIVQDNIKTYNRDGKDFILEVFKENIIKLWQDDFCGSIHVVMNLPSIAPTFMNYFKQLIDCNVLLPLDVEKIKKCLPIIHCYFFKKEKDEKTVFEETSGIKLDNIQHTFHFVRQVSGSCSMFRITFSLPFDYLVQNFDNDFEPLPKRICQG